MGLKLWGMIDLSGSLSGTPSMYSISSNSMITNIRMPEVLGKKLTAMDSTVSIYLDNEQGFLNAQVKNIKYASLDAKSVSLAGRYLKPVIYLNEFYVDSNPGNIHAVGSYNPTNGEINLITNGADLELSSLGSFIFLDPEKISGMTSFSITVDGKGKTKEELISNANGNLSFSVTDGRLAQVALLQNGIIKAKEFMYKARDLFLNSFGTINLKDSTIELRFYGYLPEREKITAISKEEERKIFLFHFFLLIPLNILNLR